MTCAIAYQPVHSLFFKRVGEPSPKADGRLLDGRAWDEFPAVAGVVALVRYHQSSLMRFE